MRRDDLSRLERQAHDLEAAAEKAEKERDVALDDLAVQLGLGEVTAGEYDKKKGAAEKKAEQARAAWERSVEVVNALRARLAERRVQAAEARVTEQEEVCAGTAEEVREAEGALAGRRDRHAEALAELERRRDELDAAAAEVDPEIARKRGERLAGRERRARWHASRPRADARVPPDLRERVAELRAELVEKEEESRERLRRHPHYIGVHERVSLATHEPFPRLSSAGIEPR
jgi:hypothetical protein